MAKQDGLTIFQKLTKVFGFQGQLREPPQFNFDREELLKTDSKEDFERARLQAQQKQYLADKWSKLDMSLYNQSVYYEPNRLSAYYDFESMEFCLGGDTQIVTPNGSISIKELADKGRDYEFIVYSYDHNFKKVVPALARNAHYTRDEMTYKVIFDDDTFIIGTWEHRLMKRDGSFARISELKEGDSMMPFYRKSFYNNHNYNWIYTCNSNEGHHGWVSEHNLIAEWAYRKIENGEEVHHIDFNGKNNLPENLRIMNIHEHRSYHRKFNNEKLWKNPEYVEKMKIVARSPKNHSWNGRRSGKQNPAYFHIPFDVITETAKIFKTLKGTSKALGIAHTKLQREIMWSGYKDWSTFCEAYNIQKSKYSTAKVKGDKYALNHKIKSIEPYGIIPVYDLTVPGYKNFATDTIFSHNTPEISAALDIYAEESCLSGDVIIPLLNGEKISIQELYNGHQENFWVYGIDLNNDKIIPAKIEKVIYKGKKDVYLIKLDDNTEIKCTEDHLWLTSQNEWIETKNLKFGTSLKSIYDKLDHKGYEKISLDNKNFKYTHRIVDIKYAGKEDVFDLLNSSADSTFGIKCKSGMIISHNCTKSERGEILTIHSDSRRIKNILDDLFYNVLDINTNLPMWARGMCKYGDDFVYLKIDPEKGIIGCQQLPNIEVERMEGARQSVPNQSDRVGSRFPTRELRFTWKNKDMEFQAWEIAHFRILGDDRRLPYGTCLKSDSYIETEKGYKKIKDICINDMVYSFDTNTQSKVLSKVLDTVKSGKKVCYKLSTKHNYIDASEEHRILFYNKKTQSFDYKNILDFNIGDLLVINKGTKDGEEIIIDKSDPEDFHKSQNYSEKNRYWNSVNEYIPDIITKDFAELFGFLIGDGGISKNTVWFAMGIDDDINNKFISLLQRFTGKIGQINSKKTLFRIHSKMLVVILQRLGFSGLSTSKRIPEWGFRSKPEIKESLINGIYLADGTSYTDKWNCTRYSFELSNEELIKDIKILIQDLGYKTGKISCRDRNNKQIIIKDKIIKLVHKSYVLNYYLSYLEQSDTHEIENRITDNFILEPIISIENIGEHDTYDIYVENEHHNFYANGIVVHNSMLDKIRRIWKQLLLAEDAMLIYRTSRAPERRVFKVFVGNMDDKDIEAYVQKIANKFKRDQVVDQKTGNVDMRYNQMAVDQDYFIPVRDQSQPSPIETLPGAQNLGEIADIEYIQKKMLAALRIPKAFLGFEDVIGNGKGLALLDIRFARTINRIQMSLIQELNKIALVHLFLLGLEDELNNFTLMLTNPSGQSDLLRIESWKEKITMYKDATSDQSQMGILPVSHTWAKKNILGMSDNEIILDLQQQRLERAMGIELQNTGMIIRRSGVFDDVDKKYGIPEAERKKIESAPPQTAEGGTMTGGGGGGMPVPPTEGAAVAPEAGGGEPPLSESKKQKILSMLNEDTTIDDLFDMEKAQRNIYEIENKLKDILNQ